MSPVRAGLTLTAALRGRRARDAALMALVRRGGRLFA